MSRLRRNRLVLVIGDRRSVPTVLGEPIRSAGFRVECFDGAAEALGRIAHLSEPCCVLSEIRSLKGNELALQEYLRSTLAPAELVFLARGGEIRAVVGAMKRGAFDVLQVPVNPAALLATITAALEKSERERETRRRMECLWSRFRTLTARERQVFTLITAGLLNKQVAFELGTSEKTVKVQRGKIVRKLGARSFADLVRISDCVGVHRDTVETAPVV